MNFIKQMGTASGLTIAALLMLASACGLNSAGNTSRVFDGGTRPGQYKGFDSVQEQLRQRLFIESFQDRFLLQLVIEDPLGSLRPLMGLFIGDSGGNRFVNGEANPMNVLLWSATLERLAALLSQNCDPETPDENSYYPGTLLYDNLRENIRANLASVCERSATSEHLSDLWISLIGFQADREALTAYVELLETTQQQENISSHDLVKGALFSILMHPEMLLKR